MERIPEPELMEEDAQVRAYAEADFEDAHGNFIRVFQEIFHNRDIGEYVLDLGCGPGDITLRFARAYPGCIVHGVDGSEAMLRYGREILSKAPDVRGRVKLIHGIVPGADLPREKYDAVISNSLLHHLGDPQALWATVRQLAAPGAPVFVMDLKRPGSRAEARKLVEAYAADEPEILRRDFHHSLLAAFEPGEIRGQLEEAELDSLSIRVVSDRHVAVFGIA